LSGALLVGGGERGREGMRYGELDLEALFGFAVWWAHDLLSSMGFNAWSQVRSAYPGIVDQDVKFAFSPVISLY